MRIYRVAIIGTVIAASFTAAFRCEAITPKDSDSGFAMKCKEMFAHGTTSPNGTGQNAYHDVQILITAAEKILGKPEIPTCELYERALQKAGGIEISGVQFQDLSLLASLQGLTSLTLSNDQISNLSGIEKLEGLLSLDVSNNNIADIRPLARLRNLRVLNLANNRVSDLSPIASMSHLRWLDAHLNKISNIKTLNNLNVVLWVELGQNSISDLSGLEAFFAHNGYVVFNENPIQDATMIPSDTERRVDLSNTPAAEIYDPPRATLPQLKPLRLGMGENRLNKDDIELRMQIAACGPGRPYIEIGNPLDFAELATPCGPYW